MPRTSHVGISLRIEDEVERERLKKVVADCAWRKHRGRAAILRTAAEGAARTRFSPTSATFAGYGTRSPRRSRPSARLSGIYEDLSLAIRTLRDLVNPRIEKIPDRLAENFQEVLSFVEELMPEIRSPRTLPGRATDLRSLRRRGRNPVRPGARYC
ncbi:ribonuclease E/G [Pseudomonas aeruginosa]|nr:ribonuclease E/G [Pseudomonas aeruginosa]